MPRLSVLQVDDRLGTETVFRPCMHSIPYSIRNVDFGLLLIPDSKREVTSFHFKVMTSHRMTNDYRNRGFDGLMSHLEFPLQLYCYRFFCGNSFFATRPLGIAVLREKLGSAQQRIMELLYRGACLFDASVVAVGGLQGPYDARRMS